jgi:hypothetical protein
MNKCFLQITVLIIVGIVSGFGQTNAWNGLVPLRSTRADVEKLLGAPKENFFGTFKYESKDGRVEVYYSTQKCDSAWNVPIGTVLRIMVYPNSLQGKNLKELKVDENKFSYTADDAFFQTWTNPEAGLQYYSDGRGDFISVTYLPKKSDNNLRCNGFPPFAPETRHMMYEYVPFYTKKLSRKKNLDLLFSRFGNIKWQFLYNFKNGYKAYAVVYFDNKRKFNEYKKFLIQIEQSIPKALAFQSGQLTFIEGGLREESRIEFYILPITYTAPAPNPTLPSPQFMRKQ